ncbi:hypothetical protein [Phascolarctobacterium faecium]|uniref:hypothetical protein n=1 Tax=Phascolarctobacterium faecium TaxID=33025 RepID=UPI003AB62336
MRKKLVILSGLIAVNSLGYAAGYDWQTPTENDWHVVIANGDMNYADGANRPLSLLIRAALQKSFLLGLLI